MLKSVTFTRIADIKIARFASTNIAAFGITTETVFHTRVRQERAFIDIYDIQIKGKNMKIDIYQYNWNCMWSVLKFVQLQEAKSNFVLKNSERILFNPLPPKRCDFKSWNTGTRPSQQNKLTLPCSKYSLTLNGNCTNCNDHK